MQQIIIQSLYIEFIKQKIQVKPQIFYVLIRIIKVFNQVGQHFIGFVVGAFEVELYAVAETNAGDAKVFYGFPGSNGAGVFRFCFDSRPSMSA